MKIIGIDLSLTSPALCYSNDSEGSFNSCQFYYLTSNKKLACNKHPTNGQLFAEYHSDQERYHFISTWILHLLNDIQPEFVFIEDYAFASTGRVFNIAENCGILKYNLWRSQMLFNTIPPTVIKKYATGKGNSNKQAMEEAFIQQTGFNLRHHLELGQSVSNPVSDIIDSYYVMKAGLFYDKTNS